ncbi:MAG: phosphoglycerate dehydrogenase [Spirochaetaceae bacterium]|nr:phosphoglycerate dehydrogenase [Spirochaetaceae bacterium]
MNKGKILVTPRSLSKSGHPLLEKLNKAGYEVLIPFPGKQPSEKELLKVLPGCIAYLAGVEKISANLLSQCGELKVISRNGVGIDNVDKEAAEKQGIALKITPGANSRGVAELAISLMLSLLRSIPQTHEALKKGGWERYKGTEVFGRTLGVIGTGQIGRKVAKMASGMDMNIIAYDPYPVPGFNFASLNEVLETGDIITMHCPATEKPLICEENIKRMKRGSYLINTARSALVDQDALLQALNSGQIAGYAVDAYDSEPPEMTNLYKHPNVIMTAHIGGFTEESVFRSTDAAVENILEVLTIHNSYKSN